MEALKQAATGMDQYDAAVLAKHTLEHLKLRPHSPERARHKFNMIQIAERYAAGVPQNPETARQQIEEACVWCEGATA